METFSSCLARPFDSFLLCSFVFNLKPGSLYYLAGAIWWDTSDRQFIERMNKMTMLNRICDIVPYKRKCRWLDIRQPVILTIAIYEQHSQTFHLHLTYCM